MVFICYLSESINIFVLVHFTAMSIINKANAKYDCEKVNYIFEGQFYKGLDTK